MKQYLKNLLFVPLVFLLVACGGGGDLTAPDDVKPVGNHKATVSGTTMTIDLSFRDRKIHRLVKDDGAVEETDAADLTKFYWTGDSDDWRSTRQVAYSGGSTVTIGVPAHESGGNGYFLHKDGKTKLWLDLGQTDGVGCSVVFQKEHTRHVITW